MIVCVCVCVSSLCVHVRARACVCAQIRLIIIKNGFNLSLHPESMKPVKTHTHTKNEGRGPRGSERGDKSERKG